MELSPHRRSFAFACGLLSLGLALEVIEHWPVGFTCSGPPRRELTRARLGARLLDWMRASIDGNPETCPPPLRAPADDAWVMRDAWDHELLLLCSASIQLIVVSAGEDGLFGTADDLRTDRRGAR